MIRIAVDGMGGDYAPRVVVDGAVLAANDFAELEIILVGQPDILKRELARHKVVGGKIVLQPASEVIGMGESPVQAIKRKKDSSMAVSIDLMKHGKADAFVTAGNTGAAVAASTLSLGQLPGIRRAGSLVTGFPNCALPSAVKPPSMSWKCGTMRSFTLRAAP